MQGWKGVLCTAEGGATPTVPPGECEPPGYHSLGGMEGGPPGRCGRDVLGEVYEGSGYIGVWMVVIRNQCGDGSKSRNAYGCYGGKGPPELGDVEVALTGHVVAGDPALVWVDFTEVLPRLGIHLELMGVSPVICVFLFPVPGRRVARGRATRINGVHRKVAAIIDSARGRFNRSMGSRRVFYLSEGESRRRMRQGVQRRRNGYRRGARCKAEDASHGRVIR